MYSRRDRSVVYDKYGLKLPNANRLNSIIEYPALNTIVVAASNVAKAFIWYAPANDKNSPTQFTEIPGVPALASVNRKKNSIVTGIYNVSPR